MTSTHPGAASGAPPSAIIFPGQGTQVPAMGAPWRDLPQWQSVVVRAESILSEPLGHLLLDADATELGRTRNAQLSVLLCSLMAWDAVKEHVTPVAFAGHSLGQVSALIASGALSFDDGLRFAAVRAERTQSCADARPGVMAALLGATLEQAEDGCRAAPDACWIANDNAPGQVVLAGTPDGVEIAVAAAKTAGAKMSRPLAVGGAFHTPLMQAAADGLQGDLDAVGFRTPSAPVVSNADGIAYCDTNEWRERSAVHVTVTVRWRLAQKTLIGLGTERIIEVGHGSMLRALAKRAMPGVSAVGFGAPEDLGGVTG